MRVCAYRHVRVYLYILRSEANVPCLPQSLSTLFGGTGSLTENLELGWARLTSLHDPGSSCLLFPGRAFQIQVLMYDGQFIDSHLSRPLVYSD